MCYTSDEFFDVWIPLESNPEIFNDYAKMLGIQSGFVANDIYELEDGTLNTVPQPVIGLIVLFNIDKVNLEDNLQVQLAKDITYNKDSIYFSRQITSNSCGTMALIHVIANNMDKFEIAEGSVLDKFFGSTKDMEPIERAEFIDQFYDINKIHGSLSTQGQTPIPEDLNAIRHHFVSFVLKNNIIFQLD